jgi:alcohol dehydrogenase YqhD (iron-dependent ADH family)
MTEFTYWNPTRVHFGRGAVEHLGDELKKSGCSRILLVYGGGSIRRNGVYEAVTGRIRQAGIPVAEHCGVRGNPVLSHVREGIEKARDDEVDLVLGVGGGSVIDEAKAIAVGAAADCDVWDFFSGCRVPVHTLPVMAVLTLPATGSEMNGISVVTNESINDKNAIRYPGLLNPAVSFLDPETTCSLSLEQTAYACTDVLSHVMEAYLTTTAEHLPVQDRLMEGICLGVMEAMEAVRHDPADYDARAAFMWSATLGWNGICQAGVPDWSMPCHALEMPMSAIYDIAHGAGLSIVYPAWMRVMGTHHECRVLKFGRKILGIESDNVAAVADALTEYYRSIGSPVSCSGAGIDYFDVGRISELALEAFRSRGMEDYPLETVREIFKLCV